MKLRTITLEGFQSYKERETVDLQDLNLTAVVGENRAGKSTLITSALMFALYGSSRTDTIGEVISRGEPRTEVTVEFDLGDSTYRIIRSRTRKGSPEASIAVADPGHEGGWKPLNEKTPKTADQFIVDLLGMNATVAEMTWMIAQGKAGVFCEMMPSKRRDALSEAFGLDRFTELAANAKRRRDAAKPAVEKARADVENLTARVAQWSETGPYPNLDDKALEAEATAQEGIVEEASEALKALEDSVLTERAETTARSLALFDSAHANAVAHHQANAQRLQAAVDAAQRDLQRAEADYAKAFDAGLELDDHAAAHTQALAAVTEVQAKIEAIRQQISGHESAHAAATAEMASVTAQAVEIDEQVRTLTVSVEKGEGVCFTCHQTLTPDHAHDLLGAQQSHKATLRKLYESKQHEAAQAQAAARAAGQQLRGLEQSLHQAQGAERAAETRLNTTRALADNEPAADTAVRTATTAHQAAVAALGEVGEAPVRDDARREQLAQEAQQAQSAMEEARTTSAQRRAQLGARRDAARQYGRELWQEKNRRAMASAELASLEQPLAEAKAAVEKQSKDLLHYEALHEAFKPSGIPFMILSGIVQEINDEANDILADLGDDGMGVQITTGADSKRGSRAAEQVLIHVLQADGVAAYSSLSGSEQLRVSTAVRLAMATCIARRSGTPIETVVMDEGWGALDAPYKRALMDMLTRLSRRFAVYTVSHIADVSDLFPSRVEVAQVEGTSRATVVRTAA